MLNQVVLVGRVANELSKENIEGGKSRTILTLAVPRSYKNENGEYDTDFINCTLWNGIAENTTEYVKKGDIVGVKGRLQSETKLNIDNSTSYEMVIVAEKVTFLSSKKED